MPIPSAAHLELGRLMARRTGSCPHPDGDSTAAVADQTTAVLRELYALLLDGFHGKYAVDDDVSPQDRAADWRAELIAAYLNDLANIIDALEEAA